MKTKTQLTNRILSLALALVMVLGMMPMSSLTAFAADNQTEKNITLGASHIEGAQASNVYFGNYYQSDASGQTKDPIKWRVLSNADGKLFLLSDKNLDVFEYHKEYEAVTWETSTMRSWLNGLANNKGNGENAIDYTDDNFLDIAFSASEQTAIADTTVVNNDNPSYGTDGGNNTTDKVFLLSIEEALNTAYGFTDNINSTDTRKATNTAYVADGGKIGAGYMYGVGEADYWWLRSPGLDQDSAALIDADGGADEEVFVSNNLDAVRPAFNIDLSSVLFTSAAKGGKSSTTAVGDGAGIFENVDISTLTDNDGYKLTLRGRNRNFAVSDTATKTVKTGDTLTLGYTGAIAGANEYISAMIVDANGEVVYYGQLAQPTAASGTVSFVVPSDIEASHYTLKLFNEQINGDYKTDFSSAFVDIALTIIPTDPVASVTTADGATTTYYTDFATAVSNWTDGTTLTLLTNVEYGESINLDSGAERTFVGGEYTLTLNGEYNPLNNDGTLNISSGTILSNSDKAIHNCGTLNINGGTVSAPQINAFAIVNYGSMTLNAGNINGSLGIDNSGTAELKGGTVTASELYALFNSGTAYLSGANLTTQGEVAALNCETGSETTISGGTLSGNDELLIKLVYSKLIITDTANCDGWTVSNVGTAVIGTDIILPNENYYMVVEERGSVTVMEDDAGTITYDAGAPTGKITVAEQNSWEKLINKITFGLLFKGDAVATVTSSDADSGVMSVEYYVASEDLIGDASLDNAAAVSKLEAAIGDNWKAYDEEIALINNAKSVIYAKITDYVGNVTYISSDGIVLDSLAPELFGIEDGGVYYGDKIFKAMDENFLKIEVDGVDITDTTEGDDEFEIKADNKEHTVTVTDKAGNVTEYTITVYKNYMVTFTNDEGGSYEKEFKYGEVITIPTNEFFEDTFRKTGYTLTKWQGYTEGMTMPLENLTFTAVYTPDNYAVEFDANGGEAIDPITVIFGEKYGRLPSSSVAGLSGGDKNWYLVDANGSVTETNIKNLTLVSTARDHKLFIKRNVLAPNVSITLAVPGGISDGYQYYIPGASQRVLTATVNNANHELLNYTYQWYKDGAPIEGAAASVLTLDGNVADSGTYKVEVTATLKDGTGIVVTTSSATGSKEQNVKILHAANTLSYDANGGEGGPQSSYTGGTNLNVSTDEPSREHYDFIGWNTKADGSGDSYKAKDAYTFTSDGGNGGCTVTLYAQWKAMEYTVTYMADGQTVSTEKVDYGKDATLPAVPHKDGYVGKWNSDGKNITGDTTISAIYTVIPIVKPDEVKPEDKADLEDTKKQLEDMLDDNAYTEDDKKAIEDAIDDIDDALEVIGNVEAVEELIDKLPDTIKKDDEASINAADDAYNALTDYEKSLVDEDAKKALDDAKATLAELNKPADPNSPATGDNSNMFLWIVLLFISGGALITLTVVDRKRRTAKR